MGLTESSGSVSVSAWELKTSESPSLSRGSFSLPEKVCKRRAQRSRTTCCKRISIRVTANLSSLPRTAPGNHGLGQGRGIASKESTDRLARRELLPGVHDTLAIVTNKGQDEGGDLLFCVFSGAVFFMRLVLPCMPKSSGSSSIWWP